jgi:hypothetical protein
MAFTKKKSGRREPDGPVDAEVVEKDQPVGAMLPQLVPASHIRAEMNDMVSIAMAYPRDLAKVCAAAIAEVALAPELAENNWYEIPFKKHTHGKDCTDKADDKCPVESQAEGLSVKAAYNLQCHYKHLASKSYVADETPEQLRVVGVARDLQNNTLVERDYMVSKVIRYRNGGSRTLSGAELVKAAGAGTSKAIRNSILYTIPDWIKKRYWDECRRVDDEYQTKKAGGKEKAKESIVNEFKKLGVTQEMMAAKIGKPLKETTDEERIKFRGWLNAIQNGEAKVEEIFGDVAPDTGAAPQGPAPSSETFTKGKVESTEKEPAMPPSSPDAEPTEKRKPAGTLWE